MSKTFYMWLNVGYCVLILILSIINFNGAPSLNRIKYASLRADYLLHAIAFIPWMLLIKMTWREKMNLTLFFRTFFVGTILATIAEAMQIFVPRRSFNEYDLIANIIGIGIGGMIILLLQMLSRKAYL